MALPGIPCCMQKRKSEEPPAMAYLSIRFHPQMNGSDLQLNTNYTNTYGENFILTTLKFYMGQYQLGNRKLRNQHGKVSGGPYWLSDLSIASSMSVSASIPRQFQSVKIPSKALTAREM